MGLQLILSLLSLSSGAAILNYHFAEDYGQIIHDYSLNGNDAVNGDSSETTSYDTIATDRGAYFKDTSTAYITLPPNDIINSGFSLGNTFSIIQWIFSFDSYDEYLSYRTNSDFSQYFYTKRGFANNVYQGAIRTSTDNEGQKSGSIDSFYKEHWMFIAVVVSGTSVVFHMNELQQFTFTLSSSYSESGSFNHYIGYTSNSFQGFTWTYQIYDTVISTTDYFSISYSTGNCLVDDCPASCSPGIKWNSLTYCISQQTSPYLSGDYHNCPSACTGLGCTNHMICYDCACATKKCHMSSSSVVSCNSCSSKTYTDISGACKSCNSMCLTCSDSTYCISCVASHTQLISGVCSCSDGYYPDNLSVSDGCKVCDSVCLTCPDATHCTTCVTDNAQPKSSGGCECKTGFYTSGSFTLTSSCPSCHSDCKECTVQDLCTTCKADNAIAKTDAGCKCMDGYYKIKDLSNQDACSQCFNKCKTCDDGVKCLTCISSNASPDTTSGCNCNSGYYASSTLDNINACSLCASECKTCSQDIICDTCVTDNAIPLSAGGCECEDGFYATGSYTSQNSCTSCYAECEICSGPDLCDVCKADNAEPRIDIGCECNVGYFKSGSLTSQDGCSVCYSECSSCNQANKCLTCISTHSIAKSDIGCNCINGYYSSGPLVSLNSCQICYEECSECIEANKCIKCIAKKSIPDETVGCKCIDGYYSSGPLTSSNSCVLCSGECKTCEQEFKCTSCIADNAFPSKQNGCKCKQGYFGTDLSFTDSCQPCSSTCKTCNQTEICIQCADNLVKNSTSHCNKPCASNEYDYLGGCVSCQNLCLTCLQDQCLTCVDNAYIKNKKCYCSKGFKGIKDCSKIFFNANMSVDNSNTISLKFDEAIEGRLLEEDFFLYFDYKKQLSYSFSNDTKKTYYFKVNIISTLPEGIKVYLNILKNDVRSSSGSFLENYNFTDSLHFYKVFFPSNEMTSSAINATKNIVIFCASASVASGLFNNPSTAWVFINTLELITYLPLGSVAYTENLVEFFTFLGGVNIVPNPSELFFTITNQSTPYKEARNYGFKTSYFIINAGPIIGSFIVFICLIPVCYFGSKLKWGKFAVESTKILMNYRYSFFVRFWIQSYLSLGILSLVQIKSVIFT